VHWQQLFCSVVMSIQLTPPVDNNYLSNKFPQYLARIVPCTAIAVLHFAPSEYERVAKFCCHVGPLGTCNAVCTAVVILSLCISPALTHCGAIWACFAYTQNSRRDLFVCCTSWQLQITTVISNKQPPFALGCYVTLNLSSWVQEHVHAMRCQLVSKPFINNNNQ
jgi:hypothetical protein